MLHFPVWLAVRLQNAGVGHCVAHLGMQAAGARSASCIRTLGFSVAKRDGPRGSYKQRFPQSTARAWTVQVLHDQAERVVRHVVEHVMQSCHGPCVVTQSGQRAHASGVVATAALASGFMASCSRYTDPVSNRIAVPPVHDMCMTVGSSSVNHMHAAAPRRCVPVVPTCATKSWTGGGVGGRAGCRGSGSGAGSGVAGACGISSRTAARGEASPKLPMPPSFRLS